MDFLEYRVEIGNFFTLKERMCIMVTEFIEFVKGGNVNEYY